MNNKPISVTSVVANKLLTDYSFKSLEEVKKMKLSVDANLIMPKTAVEHYEHGRFTSTSHVGNTQRWKKT